MVNSTKASLYRKVTLCYVVLCLVCSVFSDGFLCSSFFAVSLMFCSCCSSFVVLHGRLSIWKPRDGALHFCLASWAPNPWEHKLPCKVRTSLSTFGFGRDSVAFGGLPGAVDLSFFSQPTNWMFLSVCVSGSKKESTGTEVPNNKALDSEPLQFFLWFNCSHCCCRWRVSIWECERKSELTFIESESQALLLGWSLLLCSMRLVSWMILLCDFFIRCIVPVACTCFLLCFFWRFFTELLLCWRCLFFWIPLGLAFCEFIYDLLLVEMFQSCIQFCFLLGFPFFSLFWCLFCFLCWAVSVSNVPAAEIQAMNKRVLLLICTRQVGTLFRCSKYGVRIVRQVTRDPACSCLPPKSIPQSTPQLGKESQKTTPWLSKPSKSH